LNKPKKNRSILFDIQFLKLNIYIERFCVLKNYLLIMFSTIWMAFEAAPLRMLSATTHIFIPKGTLSSRLILPTKTSSNPEAFVASG
jgi:hypothetical protein